MSERPPLTAKERAALREYMSHPASDRLQGKWADYTLRLLDERDRLREFGDEFIWGEENPEEYESEMSKLRAERHRLRAAIIAHRSQKADDRCIEDDDRLYEALGDGIKCDRHVGNKAAMLKNCERFIDQRCLEGKWPTYVELEQRVAELERRLAQDKEFNLVAWRELMTAVVTACNLLDHPESSDSYRAAANVASADLLAASKRYHDQVHGPDDGCCDGRTGEFAAEGVLQNHVYQWKGGGSTPDGPIEPELICVYCGGTAPNE